MSERPAGAWQPPGLVRRLAAGAWHVPAGFGFLLRNPSLWPLAALPELLALALILTGAVLGIFFVPRLEVALGPAPGSLPEWLDLPLTLLLWTATIGAGAFLGLGIALLLASPLLDQLSRRVEQRARGSVRDGGLGLSWEIRQAARGALYFLLVAPFVFLLGMIPVVGPVLAFLLGGRAVAMQMTDPALTRRGATFRDKRAWHRRWLPESQGFGLAGMVGLLVPFANLLLAPALVAGATLLVVELEEIEGSARGAADPGALAGRADPQEPRP
jgi:CysZ protein